MVDKYEWYIGSQKKVTDGQAKYSITGYRPISDGKRKRLSVITVFLNEQTDTSSYKQLTDEYNEFKKYIIAITTKDPTKTPNATQLKKIYGKLNSLLSAFRAFTDVTAHRLSKRYGKNSIQLNQFETALSYEFDNVFAYRLCCQLRNYSQHAGSPITGIHAEAYFKDDIPVNVLKITMNSKILLANYEKWQSKVKADLQKINSNILLEPVLDVLIGSCSRAYAKSIITQEIAIKSAITELKEIVGYIDAGEYPILLGFDKSQAVQGDLKVLKIQPIKLELAALVENVIKQSHSIVKGK